MKKLQFIQKCCYKMMLARDKTSDITYLYRSILT